MPMTRRPRVEPSDDWGQLSALSRFPEQRAYELLRPPPAVAGTRLFGSPVQERSRQTGTPERTLYRQAALFDERGMSSLFAPPKVEKHKTLPQRIRKAIVDLKAEHPAFRPNEIADICAVRFDRRPSPHTVRRILAENPQPVGGKRRFPPYHEIADPAVARLAIVRLHSEGWAVKSITAYLDTARSTVYRILRRWVEEGVAGLDDRSHARKDGVRKVDLRAIATFRDLQENARIGEWRVHTALKRMGIFLGPRTCGSILARNRDLYGLPKPEAAPKEPKLMPSAAEHRHQYWCVDIRYLDAHALGGERVYSISVLESYSRAVLASALSRRQDLGAYLMVLFSAVRRHGAPEALVSDGGGVFRAKQAMRIYDALDIEKREIARRQPWQNLIEAQFGTQARMADWDFGRATTWEDLVAIHERWVEAFNYEDHWAHRKREDGRRSPAEVLGWVRGREFELERLHRIFYAVRSIRKLDGAGYARFRHFRLYGERGLPGREVALWLYEKRLTVAYADEPLAEYAIIYQPDRRRLREIADPHLFETPFRSPQPSLWEPADGEWLKVLRGVVRQTGPPNDRRAPVLDRPLGRSPPELVSRGAARLPSRPGASDS